MKVVIAWLSVTVALVPLRRMHRPRALCRSSRLIRSGRSRCRTTGFWGRSPASQPTNTIASGSCTGRARSPRASAPPSRTRPKRSAASPRRRCSFSTSPATSSATGAVPVRAIEWPESEHGIFIDDNDFVWLAGNGKKDGQLLKFTMDGKFVLQIGKQGQGNDSNSTERLGSPADVAVDVAAKEVFAADGYANRRVVVFDSETGAYKRHWGAYGNKPSDEKMPPYDPARAPSQQFGNPVHCIRIDKDGLVYVCDRINNRLQIFRKDGSFVAEQVYEKATRGTGSVYDLVFSPDKEQKFIYMIDGMNGEVRIVDRSSKETLGRFGRPGRQVGMFTALHNIAVDRQGNIFTSEVNTGQRVQKFRRIDMQN